MTRRFGLLAALVLLVVSARPATAQGQPYPAADGDPRGQYPPYQAQPPQAPTLQRRDAPQQPAPPFTLSPEEQRQLDWVLQQWEKQSSAVKKFECRVVRFEYDRVFGSAGAGGQPQPTHKDEGKIWYAAPDKGRFEISGERAEKWICDGKSIFEYNYAKKQVIQYDLPPELHGKAITQGPLPFLFGSTAADLRNRYWLRLTPPPEGVTGQVWLQALPRFQADRANFKSAEMILSIGAMRPEALMTVLPNDSKVSYRFLEPKINPTQLFGDFFGTSDPFRPSTPKGWQAVVERAAAAQGQPGPAGGPSPRPGEPSAMRPLPAGQRPGGEYRR